MPPAPRSTCGYVVVWREGADGVVAAEDPAAEDNRVAGEEGDTATESDDDPEDASGAVAPPDRGSAWDLASVLSPSEGHMK